MVRELKKNAPQEGCAADAGSGKQIEICRVSTEVLAVHRGRDRYRDRHRWMAARYSRPDADTDPDPDPEMDLEIFW